MASLGLAFSHLSFLAQEECEHRQGLGGVLQRHLWALRWPLLPRRLAAHRAYSDVSVECTEKNVKYRSSFLNVLILGGSVTRALLTTERKAGACLHRPVGFLP